MRTLTFILLIPISLFLAACQPDAKPDAATVEVPQLLDRPEALRHGEEWDKVQNRYGEYRAESLGDPQAGEPRLGLAEVFIHEARVTGEHGHYYPAALQVLDEALAVTEMPDIRFRALAAKAGVQLSLHQFQEALATGQKAVALNPYNAQIYGVLVDAHVELGQYDQAVAMADRMVSIRPDLRSYARVSYLREIHGRVDGAIEAMEMAVKAGYPGTEETSWARLTLGQLYQQYDDPARAEQQYRMALAERPDYPFAIAALAELRFEEGKYEETEKLLEKACAIIPEVGFYQQLAELYKATDREEEMLKTVEMIQPMLADDVASGHRMDLEYASLYADLLEDYERALTYVQNEYERRPDNIDVNRLLANLYYRVGDQQKAVFHLEKATRTDSRHPELRKLRSDLASL